MSDKTSDKDFFFIGNHLCLDFINTQIVQGGEPVDLVDGFGDLISWLAQAGVLDTARKDRIKAWGGTREAARTIALAQDFRSILRDMVERIVANKLVPEAAIVQINQLLRNQVGHRELLRVRGGFEKRFQVDFKAPIHLLVPVAESACDLLAYGDLSLIRKCESPACVLFFYDTTKNHSRRWCSMSACGNRMKVAAHYRRLRLPDAT
jgi:predicted RNA-binding Zn ribbon-like protein